MPYAALCNKRSMNFDDKVHLWDGGFFIGRIYCNILLHQWPDNPNSAAQIRATVTGVLLSLDPPCGTVCLLHLDCLTVLLQHLGHN